MIMNGLAATADENVKVVHILVIVRGDRDSRANLMPIYGDRYQIKL